MVGSMPLAWDDFRLVKAIAERGGLTRAAADLGINHSTAFRRLAGIETVIEARLFERSRSGYVPTPAGTAMIAAAERMEADVASFDRTIVGQASMPSGELRLTAPVGFAIDLLMPLLARFRDRYPAITVDLVVAEEPLNLSRRDADVALRASTNPPPNLVGRRLSEIAWAVYGRRDAPAANDRRWIMPVPNVGDGRFGRFVRERAGPDGPALQINAVIGLCESVRAGIGISPMPCYQGDACADLVRLGEPEPELAATLWLLTHPDLRHAPRVRAFMDYMAEAILPLRPALEGRIAAT